MFEFMLIVIFANCLARHQGESCALMSIMKIISREMKKSHTSNNRLTRSELVLADFSGKENAFLQFIMDVLLC